MYVRPDLSEGTAHGAGPRWCTTPAKGGPPGGRSINPRTCCPAPHGPGCAFAEGRVLPKRRVGEAWIRLERRAAKQNERTLQQAQRIVRLPGAAATPAHTYTHATPARQSWMSARRHIQSSPLSEMAFPLACRSLYPGAFIIAAGDKAIASNKGILSHNFIEKYDDLALEPL